MKRKITSLKSLLDELQKKQKISESAREVLEMSLPSGITHLIKRSRSEKRENKYSPELRAFALTLNFYSVRAYKYVRKCFNSALPHPSTLRKWCSHIDGSAGFTKETLTALKAKVGETGNPPYCALIIDEMGIRQHVEWDGTRFHGYIDYGTGMDNDQLPVAKEAWTLMLNCVNGHWKVPIGYFLINGLSAAERANIIKLAFDFLKEVNVQIISLTFDGTSTNFAMANILGAKLDMTDLHPYFRHPYLDSNVYIILDPCHMLKLVRNAFASLGIINDLEGKKISWQYIKYLESFQNAEGLVAANKLTMRHIHWYREKMKVKLAAQTLSNSVASAIEYLTHDMKVPHFNDSDATVHFLRTFDKLFDIFNSRNLLSHGFKSPLKPSNQLEFFNFLDVAENYIRTLKIDKSNISIIESSKKTGFIGFIINIHSLNGLYDLLITSKKMSFLMTYKLSQDHLEMFFSCIRGLGGWNNNLTVRQFRSAYKKLLINNQIAPSAFGNCIPVDGTSILHISSSSKSIQQVDAFSENYETSETHYNDHDYAKSDWMSMKVLSKYVSDVVGYISGFVSKKLAPKVGCLDCASALTADMDGDNLLITRRDKGGLTRPSKDVVKVCKIVEGRTRHVLNSSNNIDCRYFINICMRDVDSDIFSNLNDHIKDHDPLHNHRFYLIKSIIYEYMKVRFNHTARLRTLELSAMKIRSKNNKLTIFQGQ